MTIPKELLEQTQRDFNECLAILLANTLGPIILSVAKTLREVNLNVSNTIRPD